MLPKKINFDEMKHVHLEHGLTYCGAALILKEHNRVIEKVNYYEQSGNIARLIIMNSRPPYFYECRFDKKGKKHGFEYELNMDDTSKKLWNIFWKHGKIIDIVFSKEFRLAPSLLPKEVLPTEIKNKIDEVFNV